MSNPYVKCVSCGAVRDCGKHGQAKHPPTAAKKWLMKRCSMDNKEQRVYKIGIHCELVYRAGVELPKITERALEGF